MNDDIRPLLEQLKIKARSATRLIESSFGSKVYLIDSGSDKTVLKLFHGRREYWRERRTLELLAPTGLVPKVLDGLPPTHDFDGAVVLEFIESKNLGSSPIDSETANATGVLLAKIHGFSLGRLGFFGPLGIETIPFNGWWSFRRHLLTKNWAEIVRNRLGADFIQRCSDHIEDLSARFHDSEATCLTHCDFRFGNVLNREDDRLAVIDFESAREGDGAYDFIKIWEQIGSQSELWESFLGGYASIRALPAELPAKLRYYWFDLNFGFLYWAIDRGDEALFQRRLKIVDQLLDAVICGEK